MSDSMYKDTLGKLLLRLTVGVLLLSHGIAKIMHPGALEFIETSLTNMGLPAVIAYGVFAGEVIAPLMIIIGFYARIGGMVVVVNMIAAIALVHMADIFNLTPHGGWALELQAFYLMGGLVIALLGSGRFALKAD